MGSSPQARHQSLPLLVACSSCKVDVRVYQLRSWLIRRLQGVKMLSYTDPNEEDELLDDDGNLYHEPSKRHQRMVAQLIPQLSGLLPQDAELSISGSLLG